MFLACILEFELETSKKKGIHNRVNRLNSCFFLTLFNEGSAYNCV